MLEQFDDVTNGSAKRNVGEQRKNKTVKPRGTTETTTQRYNSDIHTAAIEFRKLNTVYVAHQHVQHLPNFLKISNLW